MSSCVDGHGQALLDGVAGPESGAKGLRAWNARSGLVCVSPLHLHPTLVRLSFTEGPCQVHDFKIASANADLPGAAHFLFSAWSSEELGPITMSCRVGQGFMF